MNKEEIEGLAKYIADYIGKDVAVMFKRLPENTNVYTLILEAVEQYDVKEQIRDKKKTMREMLSVTREKCGGSQSSFSSAIVVLNLMRNSRMLAFSLGLGKIEKDIKKAHNILLANQTMGGRIEADQVLCKIINQLDEELKNG